MQFTLEQEDYEALISLAREGIADDLNKVRDLEAFLRKIETENNITRSIVVVKWQEVDTPLPPGTLFPNTWPPELTEKIELISRPVARADVEKVLAAKSSQPENIMVTSDPAGIVGFQTLDQFFVT